MVRGALAAVFWLIGMHGAAAFAQALAEVPPRTPVRIERRADFSYSAVPGLLAVEPTLEGLRAARGNLARWRDAERARVGPFLVDNFQANQKAKAEYEAASAGRSGKQLGAVPQPKLVPEGELLEPVKGYGAHFYVKDGVERIGLGLLNWVDVSSNAGAPSQATVIHLSSQDFCGRTTAPLEDLVYLGPELTPELKALEERLRPDSPAAQARLNVLDVAWLKPPSSDLLAFTFPPRAFQHARSGLTALTCTITEGALACTVVIEEPTGWGFGEAALKAASLIEVAPQLPDGSSAIGREMCLPISYLFPE